MRFLHVPQGILSELRLFSNRRPESRLILCERFSFNDPDEAVQSLSAECCAYIDRWIAQDVAHVGSGRRPALEPGQVSNRVSATIHGQGLALQPPAPLLKSGHSQPAEPHQSPQ